MSDTNILELPSLQRLQSNEQRILLDIVDSLRAQGLSDIVDLPQLIVCGDQSSGKSSVLEAISGIPFPKQDTLCTRFATEVILRRATIEEISVSVVPGKNRSQEDRERLSRFRHRLQKKDDFGKLFEAAMEAMGLSSAEKSFSNDVLRIEFNGPTQPQLTLVDLPGMIHSQIGSGRGEGNNNVELVHNLVSQYMKNPRSIILAIVSAKYDIENQIILAKAQEADQQGLRTFGIITKPDTLTAGSNSEDEYLLLAKNEKFNFLGWHVVRNLDSTTEKNQSDTRDQIEAAYFRESRFNSLPPGSVGIASLRARLSKVLFDQIRTGLPKLVEDIELQIQSAKSYLNKLGPERDNFNKQISFLVALSQSFQTVCQAAVRGDYDHDFFRLDENPDRRLCANIMNMHIDFAENIQREGATWIIQDTKTDEERSRTRAEAIEDACKLLRRSRGREV